MKLEVDDADGWPENSTLALSRSCLSDILIGKDVKLLLLPLSLLLLFLLWLSLRLKCGVLGRLFRPASELQLVCC